MAMNDAVLTWCEDGHTWINHGDGTVSPSWGYGGTHLPVEDAARCPEPETNADGEYWCADCEQWKQSLGDCIRGLSFTPWAKEQWCSPPQPVCLKPAVGANAWRDGDLPFDGDAWCAWWVRNGGPWRLTFHQGQNSRLWTATCDCLDVHTGETFEVDRTWDARRAALADYPNYLRERWWRTDNGALIGCWSTMDRRGAGWLIRRCDVETWVREAIEEGVATNGLQLAFDVDA